MPVYKFGSIYQCKVVDTVISFNEWKFASIEWLKNNLPSCNHKRLHDTGKNPLSGFDGMFLKKECDGLKGE